MVLACPRPWAFLLWDLSLDAALARPTADHRPRLLGLVYNASISESLRSQTAGTSLRRTPQESRSLMSDTPHAPSESTPGAGDRSEASIRFGSL